MKKLIVLLGDFFSLFYPELCQACGEPLMKGEEVICTLCHFHLPKTWFHHDQDNQLTRSFWGRVYLNAAAAFLYFQKGSRVQQLLHRLKYEGHKEIGIYIGKVYGLELMKSPWFRNADVIIPVPLHIKKLRKRGYNQSEMFAEGLAQTMDAKLETGCLYRVVHSSTQTRKSRFQRWENVEDIFRIRHPEKLQGKHILIVDDVITTGATIESCAQALMTVPGVKVSAVAIAYASV